MAHLRTTRGALNADDLGLVLPHEHVFVNLDATESDAHRRADPKDVIEVMRPHVEEAMDAGVTALVECTPVGVGRRPDVVQAVSDATGFPIVLPTGIYREPWVPDWAREADEAELTDWMIGELTEPLEGCDTPAAWIKVSAGDDGMTDCERKILRAAGAAAAETAATIGSHTVSGAVVREQLDDGLAGRVLLSQDRGWYDPSKPDGGEQRSHAYLVRDLLPKLREAGVSERDLRTLTREHPFRAFAR